MEKKLPIKAYSTSAVDSHVFASVPGTESKDLLFERVSKLILRSLIIGEKILARLQGSK